MNAEHESSIVAVLSVLAGAFGRHYAARLIRFLRKSPAPGNELEEMEARLAAHIDASMARLSAELTAFVAQMAAKNREAYRATLRKSSAELKEVLEDTHPKIDLGRK